MEHWYDLNGAVMRVEAADAALVAPLLHYVDGLGGSPVPTAAAFHVMIARGPPQAAPSGARLLYDGVFPERTPCRLRQEEDGTRWLLVPDRLSLRYSMTRRKAHMQVAAGAEALIGGSSGVLLLDAVLMASRQVLLHAALLRLPRREAAIGVLAPSGAGKTTTSLALALQGFGLMTDDAMVLTEVEGMSGRELLAWGLPRPLKVHRNTARLLPETGRVLDGVWNGEDEQSLSLTALRSVVEVLPPRPAALAALVILGPRVRGQHRLRRVSKSDLLALAAADNVFGSRHGVLEAELARYRSLARAVAATPALELNVGEELESLGDCIVGALGSSHLSTS